MFGTDNDIATFNINWVRTGSGILELEDGPKFTMRREKPVFPIWKFVDSNEKPIVYFRLSKMRTKANIEIGDTAISSLHMSIILTLGWYLLSETNEIYVSKV
jgi:hypothetical protein